MNEKTTDEPPEPSADLAELCGQAEWGAVILEGWSENRGTPREVAYSCKGAAKLLKAMRRHLLLAREAGYV